MRELDFIEIIKNTLSKNSYIGDDCAYLDNLEIVVTQDSLVEDIHFLRKFSTPYMLGYKSVMVNLSDIFASGAIPKYLTISLSLPKDIENEFLKEFYRACDDLSKKFDFEVIGGDITGSDKIYVSVCAIGSTKGRNISSRANAKIGDYIIATGYHGSSAAGLWLLQNNVNSFNEIKQTHLMPSAQMNFSNDVSTKISRNYAMMDTSDGLVDAVYKIAKASDVSIKIDFAKISYDPKIVEIADMASINFRNWVLYGGEDYQMIACLDGESLSKINVQYQIIGRVEEKEESYRIAIDFGDDLLKICNLDKTFNHF